MNNLDKLDKDELRWSLEDQQGLVSDALKVLNIVKDRTWNHREHGCSYGCTKAGGEDVIKDCICSDDYKLEIYYNAIKEAIRLLEE